MKNKYILLIILLITSISLTGCIEDSPVEYEIIKVNVVENTDENSIQKYFFDIIYIDDEGYIEYASTNQDSRHYIRLKLSDNDEYRLFHISSGFSMIFLELHIPKNTTTVL